MRITKFLAATMAAMTIVSCSEQEVFETQGMEPGDAQIVLDLGRSFTTYASEKTENAILNGTAKLYDQAGATIAWKSGGTIDAVGKLTGVVDAGVISGLADKNVKVMVLANNTGKTIVAGTTEANDYLKEQASTTVADIYADQVLAGGILSSGEFALELKSGSVTTVTTPKLKRTVARIYVKKGGATSIEDYTIKVDKLSEGVKAYTYASSGGLTKTINYTVKKDATPAPTGDGKWFKDQEPVGYAYPTEVAEVTVTPKGATAAAGITKQVKLEANKNYSITITSAVGVDGEVTGDFEIKEWDKDEIDTDIDFNAITLAIPAGATLPADFTVGASGELVIANAVGTATNGVEIKLSDLFQGTAEASLKIVEVVPTYALATFYKISQDGKFAVGDTNEDGLEFVALLNHGKDKVYKAKFIGWDGTDEATKKEYAIKVVVTGMDLPENFTTTINGIEVMSVGLGTTLQATKNVVNDINQAIGADFAAKTLAYIQTNHGVNELKVTGAPSAFLALSCPSGFSVPTEDEIKQMFGGGADIPAVGENNVLTPGANTLGNSTLNFYEATANPIVVKYFTLVDAAGKIYFIPGGGEIGGIRAFNMVYLPTSGVAARYILWSNQFQHGAVGSRTDSFFRCVKQEQTLLTH